MNQEEMLKYLYAKKPGLLKKARIKVHQSNDDVFQNVIIRLLKQGPIEHLDTYVIRSLINENRNNSRGKIIDRNTVEMDISDEIMNAHAPTPDYYYQVKENKKLLEEALLKIPPVARQTVMLNMEYDNHRDVADVTGKKYDTVKANYLHGIKYLKAHLEGKVCINTL